VADTRTQDDIIARYEEAEKNDFFGFRREVLGAAMTMESLTAVGLDVSGVTEWNPLSGADLEASAQSYLDFAIGKILDHRGISASRSVDKLAEHAWLLGRDDVVKAMDEADYENYGAPKVKAFADGMGWTWPESPELARMAVGLPCEPGCEGGCGR
jgi:hypothetical protein